MNYENARHFRLIRTTKRTDFRSSYMHINSDNQPFLRILAHSRGLKSGLEWNRTCLAGKTRGKHLRAYFSSNLGGTRKEGSLFRPGIKVTHRRMLRWSLSFEREKPRRGSTQ